MMTEESYQRELGKINEFVHSSLELGVNENRIPQVLEANGFRKTKYGRLRYLGNGIRMEYDGAKLNTFVTVKIKREVGTSSLEAKRILSDVLKNLNEEKCQRE